jgi:hypothetical protein
MTPKKKKNSERANAKTSDGDSNSKGNDVKTPMTDPRLKSIIPLIATQLIPIQEVITAFAKVMLDNTRALKSRKATLAKFCKIIPATQNIATELPNQSSSMYIPKSARLKTTLTYSKALANETELKDLQEELMQCNKDYGQKVAYIFERCAKLEEKNERISRVKAFLSHCLKLTQGLVIIEKRRTILETTLSIDRFTLWILRVFLRSNKVIRLGEPNIYEDYLLVNYEEVKDEFVALFLPNDPTLVNEDENNIMKKSGTEGEKPFRDNVVKKLHDLVLPTTFHLQLKLDQDEETQITTSLISAEYKRAETMKATEATALAISDISPQGQINMEQHLKKLVQQVVKDQLTTPSSSKKRKNSPGGKKPQPSPPAKKKNGETSTTQPKKKVCFRYPISDTEDSSSNDGEQHQKKKQKRSHQPSNQTTQKKTQNPKNGKGNQGGKKQGVSRGKKKNKTK